MASLPDVKPTIDVLNEGHVVRTTLSIARQNFGLIFCVGAVLVVAAIVLSTVLSVIFVLIEGDRAVASGAAQPLSLAGLSNGFLQIVLLGLVLSAAQTAGFQVAISTLQGKAPGFRGTFISACRGSISLLPVLVLSLLASAIGSLFLIVPGVLIGLAFFVVGPVRTMERTRVFESFRRSRDLTRGNRGRVFGMVLLLNVSYWAALVVIGALSGDVDKMGAAQLALFGLGGLAVMIPFFVLTTTGTAVIYAELRQIKDGVWVSDLATVFD